MRHARIETDRDHINSCVAYDVVAIQPRSNETCENENGPNAATVHDADSADRQAKRQAADAPASAMPNFCAHQLASTPQLPQRERALQQAREMETLYAQGVPSTR